MEKKIVIPVETCSFVLASDLFKGFPKLWDAMVESNSGFTWGGNNRSMVCASDIVNCLQSVDDRHLKAFCKRIDALIEGGDTYVDLEN